MRKQSLIQSVVVVWLVCASVATPVGAQQVAVEGTAGITPEARQAIDRGLAYLARAQDRQGAWSNRGQYGAYPVAMTSLAGLAFLMDGNTTTQGRYAQSVDRAERYLSRQVRASGLISASANEPRSMYGHGFSMLFLGQLYGMTEDVVRARELHDLLVGAVRLTGRAQSRQGGWIYTPDGRSDEGSVTVTQVQGLRSCRNAGIAVPKIVIDDAMEYLVKSQNSDGGIRYRFGHQGVSRGPLTAAAVCCWYNAGEYGVPQAARALRYCKQHLKSGARVGGHDFYAHFYYAQALFIGNDAEWDEYYRARRDYFLRLQSANGSWMGDGVGDVYGTAVALVVLQLPYNRLPIMQR